MRTTFRKSTVTDVGLIVSIVALDLVVWGGRTDLQFGGRAPGWAIPTATVVVFGTLVLRRAAPVEIFAVQWVYSLVGLMVIGYQPVLGLFVALHAVASRRPTTVSAPALALCMLPASVNAAVEAAVRQHQQTPFLASFAVIATLYMVLFIAVWGLGRLAFTAAQRATAALQRAELDSVEAINEERRRIARELHDVVTHAVTAMTLNAGSAGILMERDRVHAQKLLGQVQQLGAQAMAELHRLLGLLSLTDPGEWSSSGADGGPGLSDVENLVVTTRESGTDVTIDSTGEPAQLDRSVDLAAYRVIQEALTNIIKYSRGGSARVAFRWDDDLKIDIRNWAGTREAPVTELNPSGGRGLVGLSERVRLVGGHLEFGPLDDGFIVSARLPRAGVRVGHTAPLIESG